jgi:hypothetical protein
MASGRRETSRRSWPAVVVLKRTWTSLRLCAPDGDLGQPRDRWSLRPFGAHGVPLPERLSFIGRGKPNCLAMA